MVEPGTCTIQSNSAWIIVAESGADTTQSREGALAQPWSSVLHVVWGNSVFIRESGGTVGMVPLMINPIYTLCSRYFIELRRRVKQLGYRYHPKGTTIFTLE